MLQLKQRKRYTHELGIPNEANFCGIEQHRCGKLLRHFRKSRFMSQQIMSLLLYTKCTQNSDFVCSPKSLRVHIWPKYALSMKGVNVGMTMDHTKNKYISNF